jgi:TP901 family phage tail tape measure protein
VSELALKVGELYASFGIDQTSLDSAMKSIQSKCDSIANNLMTTGTALSLAVTTPIVKIGKEIIQASIDYEDAFAGVRKTVDIESGNIEAGYQKIYDALDKMQTELPQSFETLTSIAENAGQLGVAEEYITDFTKVIADLTSTTNLTADSAATMIAQYANITGMDLGDIDKLGSTIVDLGNKSAATELDIVEMMQRLAGTGAVIDLSDTQIAGLATTLASLGIEAEMGGSAMSKMLSKMDSAVIANGGDLKKWAKIAGTSSKEFASAWNSDPMEALQMVIDGLASVDEAGGDVNATLKEVDITDVRMLDTIKRLMGSGDMLTENVALANTAWDENIALTEEAAKRNETLASKITMAKNALTSTAAKWGDYIQESAGLKAVVDKFKDWAIALGTVSDTTKGVVLKLAALAAAAGPAMVVLGVIIKYGSQLAPILAALVSPMGLVAGGLALMAVAAVDANNDIGKAFEDVAKKGEVKLTEMTITIMEQLNAISDRLPALITSMVNGINRLLPVATVAIMRILSGIMDTISSNADGILSIGTTIIESIATGLSYKLPQLLVSATKLVTKIASAIIKSTPKLIAAGGKVAKALWKGIQAVEWTTLGIEILDAIAESVSGVWTLFKGWFEEAKKAVNNIDWAEVWTNIKASFGRVEDWFVPKWEAAKNEIKAIDWASIWNNIKDKFGDVKTWFSEKWTAAKEAAQNINWAELGSNILATLTVTKDALLTKAKELIGKLADMLSDPDATSTIGNITGVAVAIAGKIVTGKADWLSTATGFITTLIEQMVDSGFLSSVISTVATTLAAVVTAISDAIAENAGSIVGCAADLMVELLEGLADTNALSTILASAADAVIAIADAIAAHAGEIATAALELATKLLEELATLDWATIGGSIATACINLIDAIVAWLSEKENLTRLGDAAGSIATELGNGILEALLPGKINVEEITLELSAKTNFTFNSDIDPSEWSTGDWAATYFDALQADITEGAAATKEQLALAMALIDEGFSEQLLTLNPELQAYATALLGNLYDSDTGNEVIANFAAVGFSITDELAMAISDGTLSVTDVLRALGIGMSDEMILSMDQLTLKEYLNTYFTETSADITAQIETAATSWGTTLGEAVPDGARTGFENSTPMLRKKTDELMKLVSAVDAETTVKAGNRATAQAGIDAMTGTLGSGKTSVETSTDGIVTSVTDTLKDGKTDVEDVSTDIGDASLASISLAIAEGTPAAIEAIETATQALIDKAVEILNDETGASIGKAFMVGMNTGVTNTKSASETAINNVANAIKARATTILTSLAGGDIGRAFSNGIASAIRSSHETLIAAANSLAYAARNAASGILTSTSGSTIGFNFSMGIANGIRSGMSAITNAAAAVAQAALTSAKKTLDINSPSGAAEDQVGAMFVAGGAKGILGNIELLTSASKTAAESMLDSFYVTDPSRGTSYKSSGSSGGSDPDKDTAPRSDTNSLDSKAIGTAMADRLIESGALQGDVYMDADKVGVKTAASSSKVINRKAKSGWKGRTTGMVLST